MQSLNKIVLITGANKGIGFGIAKKLLESPKNYNVIMTSRNEKLGKESFNNLSNSLNNINNRLFYHQMDINNMESVENCISYVKEVHSKIDIFVANAAIYFKEKSLLDSYEETLNTNVYSTINSTEKFIDEDAISQKGKIVLLGSTMGKLTGLKSEKLISEFKDPNINLAKLFELTERFKNAVANNKIEEEGWVDIMFTVFLKL